ncbi:restriction endonuclease subunit S [Pseudomonas sp.]|uniref:restriction endonuclease subunit S n=1 Tax=Pseudomonas sp. TaxID=306 RepID=UPI0028AA825B|nr:restriction endonuclease subunit S [Pseudomonas sp.]
MSELPSSWIDVAIGEIAQVIGGGTPKANDANNFTAPGDGIAWLTPADLSGYKAKEIARGTRDLTLQGYQSSSAKLMPKGSLLFSSRAPIGYVAVAANEIATNQGFKSFVFSDGVDPSYAFYYLKSIRQLADSLGTGTTFKELSGATAKTLPFRLAPTAEQTRIAAKLDELLAQVDTLKARTDGIPALLKRFRQSVLAAAVSGRLTEEERDSDAPMTVCALGDVCEFRNGFAYKSGDYKKTGIPLVRISDIDGRNASPSSDVFVEKCLYDTRFSISKGDLLIAMSGATTGKVGIYQSETLALQNQRVGNILVKTEGRIIPAYRNIVVFHMSGDIIKSAYGGAQPNISAKEICSMLINLPNIEEQTEIVRRVEQLFAFADQLETRVKAAQARINHLTQSILAKAFRGELVPQDPNDEPASVLLERIKAQRAAAPKAKRGRRTATPS